MQMQAMLTQSSSMSGGLTPVVGRLLESYEETVE